MSTRHARVADKELNDKHTKILIDLLQRSDNKICADCKKKDPRWASWNLGLFVCIRCSGTHRSLGTHISKVKSVDLDTWTSEQIESMIKWGNQRANTYWEAKLGERKPIENSMDTWIRAKYEQKLWVDSGDLPDPSEIVVNAIQQVEPTVVKEKIESPIIKDISKEFGLLYHASVNNSIEKKELTSPIPSTNISHNQQPSVNTTAKSERKPAASRPVSAVTTTSSGFKLDLSSFQEQLSGLSLGRPSSGFIPQAPPGSNTSWTNFLVNQTKPSGST
ncbi:hypothetical protein EDC94DRAFT_379114 [Helicostylum pulchrum]|nr:hypothetical protein EDC94DRAFT_379114 [Helicostylum pulchrum]